MPALTARDRRTLRFGVAAIVLYLAFFYGWSGWNRFEAWRSEYTSLQQQALTLKQELLPLETKLLRTEKLRENFRGESLKLSKPALMAEISAAIQKAAKSGGVQLGPVRESPARSGAKEMASMQLEGSGPVAAMLKLLQRFETLGYPLLLESVQFTAEPTKPGMVKLSLTVVILDFQQWKNEEPRHA